MAFVKITLDAGLERYVALSIEICAEARVQALGAHRMRNQQLRQLELRAVYLECCTAVVCGALTFVRAMAAEPS